MTIRAITFDLDETLWPIAPAIQGAEAAVRAWFEAEAPEAARAYPAERLREVRAQVLAAAPERAHDLRWVRRQTFAIALERSGYDPARAAEAFEIFDTTRQRVTFFPDAIPALEALAARFRLAAISNGFADLERIGIDHLFAFSISAVDFGTPKPHPRIFHAACERLGCMPAEVVHVGDDVELDVRAAHGAGLRGVWINRRAEKWPHEGGPHAAFEDLAGFVEWIERQTGL